jgi:hypothetical protein
MGNRQERSGESNRRKFDLYLLGVGWTPGFLAALGMTTRGTLRERFFPAPYTFGSALEQTAFQRSLIGQKAVLTRWSPVSFTMSSFFGEGSCDASRQIPTSRG